jgi:hypothetical protein
LFLLFDLSEGGLPLAGWAPSAVVGANGGMQQAATSKRIFGTEGTRGAD